MLRPISRVLGCFNLLRDACSVAVKHLRCGCPFLGKGTSETVGSAVSPLSGGRNLDLPRGRNAGGEVDRGRDDGLLFRKGSLSETVLILRR